MKRRPPIDPNQPIIIPPHDPGTIWALLLFTVPVGILANILNWPAWTLWLGPIIGLGWELAAQWRELRRIAAAWNDKLTNERAAYKPGPEKPGHDERDQL